MNQQTTTQMRDMVGAVYRAESRRVFATLVRLLGDFDAAEEALHEAFRIASGIPPARIGSIELRPIRPIRETVAFARQRKP